MHLFVGDKILLLCVFIKRIVHLLLGWQYSSIALCFHQAVCFGSHRSSSSSFNFFFFFKNCHDGYICDHQLSAAAVMLHLAVALSVVQVIPSDRGGKTLP